MKQVLQNMRNGETRLVDVPCPTARPGKVLIASRVSLVSAGTERMLVQFGRANMIDKARQQPDKVKQVLTKVRTDGLSATMDAVRSKLDQPLPLGYCNVGTVLEAGAGVDGFSAGDRVVSNGPHAQVVNVPTNLCCRIPDGVDDETASFTVIGAIALQGIRLAQPTLGEAFVVSGLGLIGLMAVQLLRANGCRVLGIDFDEAKLTLARQFGAETVNLSAGEDPVAAAQAWSRGRGVDGVIVTAATKSSEPMAQAARMSRKRGRIILVGVTGLELSRADFYEKELTFQVSCSYGPGRYDTAYEERGQDYPVGFVRWTEQRNFEAVLDMMADGRLDVRPLISHRFPIAEAVAAYDVLNDDAKALGILLQYPEPETQPDLRATRVALAGGGRPAASGRPVCAFIGAGNYASRVLIPAFRASGAELHTVVSEGGVSGVHHGARMGFAHAVTEAEAALADAAVNTVVVATRHDSHADYVCRALAAGKHVFVEKPLALTHDELDRVAAAVAATDGQRHLMVGFNRRFAPQVVRLKALLTARRAPKSIIMTVNAGAIPATHWTQDPAVGGGRVIGEGCHFIDLMRHLVGQPIVDVRARDMRGAEGMDITDDKAAITLGFADGSFGTIHYLANGGASFPKERIEVFCGGGVLQIDNFRRMTGYDWPGFSKLNLRKQDKGQDACAAAFLDALARGQSAPIPVDELIEVSRATIDAGLQLRGPADGVGTAEDDDADPALPEMA